MLRGLTRRLGRLKPFDWPLSLYLIAWVYFLAFPYLPRVGGALGEYGARIQMAGYVVLWLAYPAALLACLVWLAGKAATARVSRAATVKVAFGFVAVMLSAALPVLRLPLWLGDTMVVYKEVMESGPTIIRKVPGRPDVEIVGGINEGLAGRLREYLDAHPETRTVYVTSMGGLMKEGQAIRRLVRDRGLDTYAPRWCNSACAMIFAGGRNRYLKGMGAHLGYHSAAIPTIYGDLVSPGSDLFDDIVESGLPPWFAEKVQATPHDRIWIPSHKELLDAGAVTMIVDADVFPMAGIGKIEGHLRRGGGEFASESLRLLERISPRDARDFEAWFAEAYAAGMTHGEAERMQTWVTSRAIALHLAKADDADVVRAGHYLHAGMVEAAKEDEVACARIGQRAAFRLALGALEGRGSAVSGLLEELVVKVKGGEDGLALGIPGLADSGHLMNPLRSAVSCADAMRPYREALVLPDQEAAPRIRELLRAGAGFHDRADAKVN